MNLTPRAKLLLLAALAYFLLQAGPGAVESAPLSDPGYVGAVIFDPLDKVVGEQLHFINSFPELMKDLGGLGVVPPPTAAGTQYPAWALEAVALPRDSRPWLVLSNGKTGRGVQVALPESEAEARAYLEACK